MFDVETRDKCIRDTVQMMKKAQKDGTRFDAIAVCGISGLILGSPVAILLNKRLIVVRKADDKPNSYRSIEGGEYYSDCTSKTKYLSHRVAILDDLIDHGDTVAHICERLTHGRTTAQRIVGIFLYNPMFENREQPEWNVAVGDGKLYRQFRLPIFCLPEEPLKCYL